MAVILAEQYHEAAEVVAAAAGDSSVLREYGFEEESAAEFIAGSAFDHPVTGEQIQLHPLSLAMGLSIGIVARAMTDPYRAALEQIRDYEETVLGPPPDDAMREIAKEALA